MRADIGVLTMAAWLDRGSVSDAAGVSEGAQRRGLARRLLRARQDLPATALPMRSEASIRGRASGRSST